MKNLFLIFLLILNFSFGLATTFAQYENDGYLEDSANTFLPSAPGTTYTGEEQNIYLNNSQPQSTTVQRTPAQTANGKLSGVYEGSRLSCPYAFERDLFVGTKGEDVRLLQVLLNSDKRTIVALDGPGSPGKETTTFGESTKVAVKKFQALFIEYIGVANGRFGPRSRTTMNAICNGQAPVKSGNAYTNVTSVQANATPAGEITEIPNDKIAPRVSLSANLNSVEPSSTFKVVANFSEEVKPITPDSVIVDGGSVKEIRKLSKTSYSITITPNEDARSVVVQVEADKVEDLAGNVNENASNEISVKLRLASATSTNPNDTTNLDSLVSKIVGSTPNCNYDSAGKLITLNPTTGAPLNPTGCPLTNANSNLAQFNSSLGCYGDTGNLPTGITDVQRCSHPQNPNNPNSPCSAQNQNVYRQQLLNYQQQMQQQSMYGYGYGYAPQPPTNPCTNPSIANATQNQAYQAQQAAQQQARQQASQNSALGQMLGNLLGKGGLGGLGGGQGGGSGAGGGGGGGNRSGGDTGKTGAGTQAKPEGGIPNNSKDGDNCQVTNNGSIGGAKGTIEKGKCVIDNNADLPQDGKVTMDKKELKVCKYLSDDSRNIKYSPSGNKPITMVQADSIKNQGSRYILFSEVGGAADKTLGEVKKDECFIQQKTNYSEEELQCCEEADTTKKRCIKVNDQLSKLPFYKINSGETKDIGFNPGNCSIK